ncbi:putative membrane protein [Sphingomonas endophytica]|jgi:putative membrane protein|uniref:Protoporphyrinogen IX oxidase n=1 Tax=Sphingomonas endophytica TaxID=869719 RepID=A0A7X0MPU2_9SPHN|nr:CopD family protein [Sphingomonas endophytica]MBB6504843.1 putative membrane protein [Sphingomonas endophytica]
MVGFLGATYDWVKAAHVIFVIFWMAGLFMLPRYLVYHQEGLSDPADAARWVERENKLRAIILTPAMIVVWVLGLALALNAGIADGVPGLGWLHAKLAIVLLLSGYHGWAVGYAKKLARGRAGVSNKALRMMNEIPALATALIVILVIVKPF